MHRPTPSEAASAPSGPRTLQSLQDSPTERPIFPGPGPARCSTNPSPTRRPPPPSRHTAAAAESYASFTMPYAVESAVPDPDTYPPPPPLLSQRAPALAVVAATAATPSLDPPRTPLDAPLLPPPVPSPRARMPNIPARLGSQMATALANVDGIPEVRAYSGYLARPGVLSVQDPGPDAVESLSFGHGAKGASYMDIDDAYHRGAADPFTSEETLRQQSVVHIEVQTNVVLDTELNVMEDLIYNLAKIYSRPPSKFALHLNHSQCMLYAGTLDATYTATISALPHEVSETCNRRNISLIQHILRQALRVPPSRGIVRFVALPEGCLGYDGTTLQTEIDDLVRRMHGNVHVRVAASTDTSPVKGGLARKPTRRLAGMASMANLPNAPHLTYMPETIMENDIPARHKQPEFDSETSSSSGSARPSTSAACYEKGIKPKKSLVSFVFQKQWTKTNSKS